MSFVDLQVHPQLLKAIEVEGYSTPTPIQVQAIPPLLAGSDLMGIAQTGTGKTAAFALPILQSLLTEPRPQSTRAIRTLVLAPTRELAAQINASFNSYGRFTGLRFTAIFGGVKQGRQVDALRAGVDVLIATPGRLLDLINQGFVKLDHLRHLVLDEADNMLDMGFIPDIRRIIARCPKVRQTMMFSATMPPDIRSLAVAILHKPVHIQVAAVSRPIETVTQSVIFIEKTQKPSLLCHYLKKNGAERVLVFARTKHGADRVAKQLLRSGIRAMAIHGNKSQNARVRAIADFKSAMPPVLVATDIAARGLDIDDITHVVNYDLPNVPETYVHRIGRTGRAGAEGIAVSFCDHEERAYLRDIEKLTKIKVPVEATPVELPALKAPPISYGPPERHEPSHMPHAKGRPAKHGAKPPRQQSQHPQPAKPTVIRPQGPNGRPANAQPQRGQGGPQQNTGRPAFVPRPHKQSGHNAQQQPRPSHPIFGPRKDGPQQQQQQQPDRFKSRSRPRWAR